MKTWVAVINRAEAKFFEIDSQKKGEIRFLSKMENPKGRLKAIDINSDRPGFTSSSVTPHRGRLVKLQSPVERISQMFALKIARFLDKERSKNSFDQLTLIVAPSFLGKVRGAFSKELYAMVNREIAKDLRQITNERLRDRLSSGDTEDLQLQ